MSEEKPAEPAAEAAPEGEGGEQLEVRIAGGPGVVRVILKIYRFLIVCHPRDTHGSKNVSQFCPSV